MGKEELEIAVLKSNLDDNIKLEVIRCIEKAKENSCNPVHLMRGTKQ